MYRLIQGDVVQVLHQLDSPNSPKVDLTVTSPPYCLDMPYAASSDGMPYPKYLGWCFQWLMALWYVTAQRGRLCLNIPLDTNKGGYRAVYADLVEIARRVGWQYRGTIIWNEGNISRRTAWGSWRSATAPNFMAPVETVVVFYKGASWKRDLPAGVSPLHVDRDRFLQSTLALWEFPGEKKARFGHPAPFPEELPRRCIELFSFPGDLVCDPFLGTGTTGAVCEDREFLGIDISSEYMSTAYARLVEKYTETGVSLEKLY